MPRKKIEPEVLLPVPQPRGEIGFANKRVNPFLHGYGIRDAEHWHSLSDDEKRSLVGDTQMNAAERMFSNEPGPMPKNLISTRPDVDPKRSKKVPTKAKPALAPENPAQDDPEADFVPMSEFRNYGATIAAGEAPGGVSRLAEPPRPDKYAILRPSLRGTSIGHHLRAIAMGSGGAKEQAKIIALRIIRGEHEAGDFKKLGDLLKNTPFPPGQAGRTKKQNDADNEADNFHPQNIAKAFNWDRLGAGLDLDDVLHRQLARSFANHTGDKGTLLEIRKRLMNVANKAASGIQLTGIEKEFLDKVEGHKGVQQALDKLMPGSSVTPTMITPSKLKEWARKSQDANGNQLLGDNEEASSSKLIDLRKAWLDAHRYKHLGKSIQRFQSKVDDLFDSDAGTPSYQKYLPGWLGGAYAPGKGAMHLGGGEGKGIAYRSAEGFRRSGQPEMFGPQDRDDDWDDWGTFDNDEGGTIGAYNWTSAADLDSSATPGAKPQTLGHKDGLSPDSREIIDAYKRAMTEEGKDAPFKGSWRELLLKRLLRHAKENRWDGAKHPTAPQTPPEKPQTPPAKPQDLGRKAGLIPNLRNVLVQGFNGYNDKKTLQGRLARAIHKVGHWIGPKKMTPEYAKRESDRMETEMLDNHVSDVIHRNLNKNMDTQSGKNYFRHLQNGQVMSQVHKQFIQKPENLDPNNPNHVRRTQQGNELRGRIYNRLIKNGWDHGQATHNLIDDSIKRMAAKEQGARATGPKRMSRAELDSYLSSPVLPSDVLSLRPLGQPRRFATQAPAGVDVNVRGINYKPGMRLPAEAEEESPEPQKSVRDWAKKIAKLLRSNQQKVQARQ